MKKSHIKQPLPYIFWAWLGRSLYNLRERMEVWQLKADEKAGQYWNEDWPEHEPSDFSTFIIREQ